MMLISKSTQFQTIFSASLGFVIATDAEETEMFTSDMHRADLVRSFGPDRVMATAPIGAVSNITSTAIVKICKKKNTKM